MLSQTSETCENIGKVGKWLRVIKQLSYDTLCEEEVEQILCTLDKINSNNIRITFIGSPNSGKSSIINGLLERKIIPVTALSSEIDFEIKPSINEQMENFSFLSISRPLEEMKNFTSSLEEHRESGSFVLTVSSNWMSSKSLVLKERPPLNTSDNAIEIVIDEYLQSSDIVILVIDALMPLKKAEAVLLKECVKRKIPIIVTLTKTDKIPAEEQNCVISYVKKYVESCSVEVPVLEIRANAVNEFSGINNLKILIDDLVERVDFQQVRDRQVAFILLKIMKTIQNTAQMALDVQKKNEVEKKNEIERLRQKIDSQNIIWLQIEQNLTERRQKIERQVSKHLEDNINAILETLFYELEKSKDVKTWWNNYMPILLQHELHNLALQLSSSVNQQIASDLKWLQEELAQKFNCSFEISIGKEISIDKNRPKQNDLTLADNSQFKIIAKVGSAAVVVAAGALLVASTGVALVTGAITGLVVEKLIRSDIDKDREKVRNELKMIISKTIAEYSLAFSQRLRSKYEEINTNLKKYNSKWQELQLNALNAAEQRDEKGNKIDFDDILHKINTLSEEIRTQL